MTVKPTSTLAGSGVPLSPKVAVLFHRFGPYHHARINAAGAMMPVWGVEACGMEGIYAWDKVDGAKRFTRITLTERDSGDGQWRKEVRHQMWRALDSIQPQVVAVPGWIFADALSALAWCVHRRVPAVVMSESSAWDEPRKPWKEWVKSCLVRLCAAGLAGGKSHAEYLVRLGLPADRIFLGYDSVDNDHFFRGATEARSQGMRVHAELGLPERYFLASARFVEKKNLVRLIEAYAQYRSSGGAGAAGRGQALWDLVLIGDGPLRQALADKIIALGLQGRVHLPGFKQYDELPAYYGLAGAFIHASTTEQWGLVVNEAMASGLPVLVSNRCGCAGDVVRDARNGFVFDPHDVDGLANLMRKVSGPGFPLADFGAESRRIIGSWGPERFATGLQGAVAAALKTPPPRAGIVDRLLLRLLLSR